MHRSTIGSFRLPAFLYLLSLVTLGVSMTAHAAAPTISGTPSTSVSVGSKYSFRPTASDADGQRLRFSIANKPSWASFSGTNGRLSGTPRAVGLWENIEIRVSDGTNTTALPAFSIRAVSRSNVAPTISGTPATSVTAGQAYTFQPTASDPDGNTLGFSIQNRPTWATFSSSTGRLSGTPAAANVGTSANVIISVSDGQVSTALPAFSITVQAAANGAPVISGTPATTVSAGSMYNFRPTASDPNGDPLTFSIANRPQWATFNTTTGQLSGTPTSANVGTYSNVAISVSDGQATVSLPAFAITVKDLSTNGSATLSWTAPTRNTDGSTLTSLAGFRIYYGTSSAQLNQTIQVHNPGANVYVIEGLAPGTYYFAVRAYTSTGTESVNSNVANKVVQ